jgi:hypothetical protein
MLRPTVSRPVSLSVKAHMGPKTRFLLLSDTCEFVEVGRPLWREDGSVICNCWWSSPAQLFSVPSPAGLITIFYCLGFETPPTCRASAPYIYIYIPEQQGGLVIPPGTGYPFHRLLRLAGLRWKYSNPPLGGQQAATLNSGSGPLYDWWFTANRFVLAPSPFRPTTRVCLYFATEPLLS